MRSPGINGEGELRGQPANPGSPGKMAIKTECVCVCVPTSEVAQCVHAASPHLHIKLFQWGAPGFCPWALLYSADISAIGCIALDYRISL